MKTLLMILCSVAAGVIFFQQTRIIEARVEIEKKQFQVDSLNSEVFTLGTIIGRYEVTVEHLKEVNPSAADEFESWMSKNTE